jgi:F-type H+-transporting ATPase subunit a
MAESSAQHNPLNPGHLFSHVQDTDYLSVPKFLAPPNGEVKISQWFSGERTERPVNIEGYHFKVTKFMMIEVVVAILLSVIFIRLAHRMRRGIVPKGRWWNLLESMLVYMRDEVARPAIGDHGADRFLPFLWTMFFFVLGCNLFGLLPWAGSPTAALGTTVALALVSLVTVLGSGMAQMGPLKFWTGLVPHIELPFVLAIFLIPMIFVIEVMGLFIKHLVLAIRLLANMMAGHLVLAVIVAFIAAAAGQVFLFWSVMPMSVLGATALSLLELFVAFLQAYIFTFLTAIFIGMAIHPH